MATYTRKMLVMLLAAASCAIAANGAWTETAAVPEDLLLDCSRRGTVERLDYKSVDRTSAQRPATDKVAYVYLPHGYDKSKRYDVIYLMHGWTGVAEEHFANGRERRLRNLFDNMIDRGLCRPFIAVSPTWDKDNRSKGWDVSVREIAVFHEEYEKELIPAVESRYSTYAQTVDRAGIVASRDHRVFGGFSLGSVTTWYVFEHCFDLQRYYLPMSGDSWHVEMFGGATRPKETAEFLAGVVRQSAYANAFHVWHAVGTQDVRGAQTHNLALALMDNPGVFGSATYSYHRKGGGRHDFVAVREFCYNALPFFFPPEKFKGSSTINEVTQADKFGGFGRLIFPLASGYWSGGTLDALDLTWYSCIRPEKTVEIVNHLYDEASLGKTVFYDIYSEAEKRAVPSRRDTGLFFFRGREGAPFAVCSAGGGFAYVGAIHDSMPHAMELSKRGVNAFALIYRPNATLACEDLTRAVEFIRSHAGELGVSEDGYSLWGGSAGARMAAWVGESVSPSPGAVIMQYTGLSSWSRKAPPTYAICGDRDGIASWRTMKNRLDEMSAAGIPTRFRLASGLGHGFGLGIGTSVDGWIDDALAFWKEQSSSIEGLWAF